MEEAEFEDPKTGRSMMLPVSLGEKLGYRRIGLDTPKELLPADDADKHGQTLGKIGDLLTLTELVDLLKAKISGPDAQADEEFHQIVRLLDWIREIGLIDESGQPKDPATPPADEVPPADKPAKSSGRKPAAGKTAAAVPATGTTAPTGQVSDPATPPNEESSTNTDTNHEGNQ